MAKDHGIPDSNFKPSLTLIDFSTSNPFAWEGSSSLGAGYVQIVDNSGTPIVSFGGGTQYTDAGTAAAHPVGTGIIFNNGGTYNFVSATQPLPITGSLSITNPSTGAAVPATANYIAASKAGTLTGLLLGSQTSANSLGVVLASDQAALPVTGTFWQATQPISGTVTANAGTNLNTSLLALESGGNLAAIKADVDKIPSQGQALATASMPVVLPAAQVTTLTPPSNTGYALDSSLSTINTSLADVATLGAKTDAKSTATDGTSVSIMQVLKEISAMEQAPASRAVTNAGTFAVQAALNAETTKVIGTVNVAASQTIAVTQATASNLNATVTQSTTLPVTIATVGITASASGDNTVIAAQGVGKVIYVFAWNLSFSGTCNAKFTDGAAGTLLNGLIYGVANAGGGNSVTPPYYLWKGTANTALVLNLSGAVAVGGSVSYYVI